MRCSRPSRALASRRVSWRSRARKEGAQIDRWWVFLCGGRLAASATCFLVRLRVSFSAGVVHGLSRCGRFSISGACVSSVGTAGNGTGMTHCFHSIVRSLLWHSSRKACTSSAKRTPSATESAEILPNFRTILGRGAEWVSRIQLPEESQRTWRSLQHMASDSRRNFAEAARSHDIAL